ncbi:MAG: DedA family protein [Pseudanabaenaceae cyanobacterium bins.68]|nr:DedA family protein [Pseudanabaenaceae cyanobacterium bins.68]
MELFSLDNLEQLAHQYGYWLVFGGIMLENAGIPLPGETITLVGGFLAGTGELVYTYVLVAAIAGAILGDNCGYWLGRWGGINLLEKIGKLFHLPADELLKARDKFSANADRAVFFGRFITLLRIFAGPLAGMAAMPYGRFLLFNSLGAIAWASLMVSLAFGAGKFAGSFIPLPLLSSLLAATGLVALGGVLIWYVLIPLGQNFWRRRQTTHE